jgi:hypothetical protein
MKAESKAFHTYVTMIETKITVIQDENVKLRAEVNELRSKLDENLQYQRRNNLIISNIPGEPNEDERTTLTHVKKLCTELQVQVNDWDIVRAHRLPPRRSRNADSTRKEPPVIIVKLLKMPLKKELISASILKKPTTALFGSSAPTRIYLNDHLLKETQALFNEARYRLIKLPEQGLKFSTVRHRDGKISAKKSPSSRPVFIAKKEDIDCLVASIPSIPKSQSGQYSVSAERPTIASQQSSSTH